MPEYRIALARPSDIAWLSAIEIASAQLLVGHAPDSVLAETTSWQDFEQSLREGHLWVALADDLPVGFAQVKLLEPFVVHLQEIDVHPLHGRNGLGTRLVMAVCTWAATAGYQAVTLTTFRDVPFNMPFYAKLGFKVIPPDELSPSLRAVVDAERQHGLDITRRVAMRRVSAAHHAP